MRPAPADLTPHITPAVGDDEHWRDRYRAGWLLGLLFPLWPFLSYGLVAATGNGFFWWLSAIHIALVAPLLDWLLGHRRDNPPLRFQQALLDDPYYARLVCLFPLLQWLALALGVWVAASGMLHGWQWLAWTLTLANVNAHGINAAHELGHKRGELSRLLAKLSLVPACYGHFFVEHNRGHHVRVATPEDPASARLGESFWQFLPRTVSGSARSAWRLEAARLQRQGLTVWHWRNENLQGWLASLLLALLIGVLAGGWVLLWFLAQAAQAIMLLELVNYVEHYGLLRQRLDNGRYQPCTPAHSWNSDTVYSNLMLFQLQRHSDHHANPTLPYQLLRHFDESPQLPAGYATMVWLAYIPLLWFRVMNPRVLSHYGGQMQLANLSDGWRRRYT